jgi:cytochrome oxidase Cu insertion factor (SCO1/SenC/PrrC family)
VKVLTALLQITVLTAIGVWTNSHSPSPPQRSTPVAVGEIAPDFTLEDQNGNKVTLSEARGKSAVVVVFYRGYW